jgi:hypothetical protein
VEGGAGGHIFEKSKSNVDIASRILSMDSEDEAEELSRFGNG